MRIFDFVKKLVKSRSGSLAGTPQTPTISTTEDKKKSAEEIRQHVQEAVKLLIIARQQRRF